MSPSRTRASVVWDFLAEHAIFVVLVFLYLAAIVISQAFLNPTYVLNMLRQAAPVGIAAIGVTYVMILGGVDLSIGSVISLAAVVCAAQMGGTSSGIVPAVAVTCLVGVAIGTANGLVIAFSRVSPFILTLGSAILIYGITQIYTGGTARGYVAPGFREFFNLRVAGLIPVLAIGFLVLVGIGLAIERATNFGRYLFLVGSNRAASELAGLPVRPVTVAAYAISGLFGSFAGIALLARSGVSSTIAGQGMEFQVLAAVVLGGTTFEGGRGGGAGTFAGVLVLLLAFNLVNIIGLDYDMQLVVMGLIIVLASALYGQLKGRSS